MEEGTERRAYAKNPDFSHREIPVGYNQMRTPK